MYGVNEYIVARIAVKAGMWMAEGARELLKTAKGERELGVDIERGSRKTAMGSWKLSRESKLEAELGLAATALGNKLSHGVAGNAAVEAAIENRTPKRALLGGGDRTAEEVFWCHRHSPEFAIGTSLGGRRRPLVLRGLRHVHHTWLPFLGDSLFILFYFFG